MKAAAKQERFVSPTRFEPKDRDAPNQSARYTERSSAMREAFHTAVRHIVKPTPLVRSIEAAGKRGAGTFRKPEWRLLFGQRPCPHVKPCRLAWHG